MGRMAACLASILPLATCAASNPQIVSVIFACRKVWLTIRVVNYCSFIRKVSVCPQALPIPWAVSKCVEFGGRRMSRVRYLHAQAERCFRLANGSAGLQIADELEALGEAFEREAREIEDLMQDRIGRMAACGSE